MKYLFFILLFLMQISIVSAREVININKDWFFGKSMSSKTENMKHIDLPHSWYKYEMSPSFVLYRGSVQYHKEFYAPHNWQNKNIYLRFKGVATTSHTFINGRFVGEHSGAYTAFTYNITPYLNYGTTNSILVNVDNSVSMDVIPLSGDYNVYGGIYRDVEIIVTDKCHVLPTHFSSDGVYVKQQSLSSSEAEVNVKVMVGGDYGDKISIKVHILDQGKEVATSKKNQTIGLNGSEEVDVPIKIKSPRMWNGKKDPFMYKCVVDICDIYGNVKDQVKVNFGLRNVLINRNKGFNLNGSNYPIYGVTYIQDKEECFSALTSLDRREDIALIEEIGATAIRTANAPHHHQIYDMCDRKGIITWVDLPFTGDDIDRGMSYINSINFTTNAKTQLEEMMYQLYNHPSIVFIGLFSNIAGGGDNPVGFVKELNDMVHNLRPNVLTVGCSNQDGPINNITDAISWSQYVGWRKNKISDFRTWVNSFANNWKNLKPGVGEYGVGGSIYQQGARDVPITENGNWHPEKNQTQLHADYINSLHGVEYMWGYFVNSMFDYGSSHRNNGDKVRMNNMGLITYNRHTKKDAFYLYKANWNKKENFVHIAERRNTERTGNKHDITVFSNCRTVDLIINGASYSTVTPIKGVATWKGIPLKRGNNTITARCGEDEDTIDLVIYN